MLLPDWLSYSPCLHRISGRCVCVWLEQRTRVASRPGANNLGQPGLEVRVASEPVFALKTPSSWLRIMTDHTSLQTPSSRDAMLHRCGGKREIVGTWHSAPQRNPSFSCWTLPSVSAWHTLVSDFTEMGILLLHGNTKGPSCLPANGNGQPDSAPCRYCKRWRPFE